MINQNNIVEKVKIGDRVQSLLREAIMLGEIEPQTHLKESVLSKEMGVSRGPIREAITQLEWEGLVHTLPNGRTIVDGYTAKDIENLYRTRNQMEMLAISQLDYEEFKKGEAALQECIDLMETAVNNNEKAVEADLQFHFLLIRFSKNKTLIQLWRSIYELTKVVIQVTQDFTLSKEIIVLEKHKRIFRALKENDIEKAQSVLQEHLLSANQLYLDAMKERRKPSKEK